MDEFSSVYDEWMIYKPVEIEKNFTAKDMVILAKMKYPNGQCKEKDENFDFLYEKALAAHQKIAMMMYAKSKFLETQKEFESTQNMDVPVLSGIGKTALLFYFESMIIFARNVLDVSAYIYSDLLWNQRMDSFNKFLKKLKKSEDTIFKELKQYYFDSEKDEMSVLKLLCGSEKGRALRDIIVHQANVRMEYYEYKQEAEKERLFLEVKDIAPIDMEFFISQFTQEIIEILDITNKHCKIYIEQQCV